jgi:hypothetical protein
MIDLFAIIFSTGMVLLVIVQAVRLEKKQDLERPLPLFQGGNKGAGRQSTTGISNT